MPDIPQPKFTDLTAVAEDLISAHTAVAEGIAAHAQKHEVTIDARRRKLEAERKLQAGIVNNGQ